MTSPEPTVPPQAIEAALAARDNLVMSYEDACRLLEAAAPHLAAAQAEQLAAWLEGPEAAAVTANAIRAQVDREIAEAVAVERERCAQLAEQHGARYAVSGNSDAYGPYPTTELFADLLRQEGGGT